MVEAPNEPSRLISIPGDAPGADGAAAAPPPTASPSGAPDSTGAASDGSASAGTSARLDIAREDGSESAPDAGTDTVTLPRAEAEARESAAAPSSVPMLRVEAVEIEAGQVYVAGAAEAGSLVRVYIDNVLLAEDRATPAGRFLVNADATVAPGDHVVRADQVARDGSVSGRAEVPFQRPEGPSVAMVAPRPDLGTGRDGADERTASGEAAATRDDGPAGQEPPPASAASAAAPASETAGEDETEIVADETADDAAASANGASAAPEPPPASAAPAAAPASGLAVGDDPEIVAQDPADDLPAEASGDVASAPATDAAAGDRSPADATGDELATRGPSDAPDAGAGLNAAAGRPAGTEALATSGAGTAPAEGQVPASPEAGEAGIPADPSAVAAASESVPVTRQEALTTAPGRVIIRRGDTLWRISRENYGFGSRYVVIYLANGDQIRDPDLIYPGQVFSVPEERVDTSDAGGAG
jgi:nucleoid-associated protein YgaU